MAQRCRRRLGHVACSGVALLRHGSYHIVRRQRPPDPLQLELTDRSTLTEGQDFRVFADQTWRLGDLGAKHALLLAGIGWGNMPAAMVRADLQSGRLVRLDLPDWRGGTFTMHLLHAAGARRVLPGDG